MQTSGSHEKTEEQQGTVVQDSIDQVTFCHVKKLPL